MTTDEALKLASALDHWATQMDMGRKPDPKSLIRKTSVELRRLQAELDATKQALAAPVQPGRNHYEDGDVFERIAAKKKPAAQPAPVQPVAWMTQARNFVRAMDFTEAEAKLYGWTPIYTTPPAAPVLEGRDWSLLEATQESLREHVAEIKRLKAAQPAVPDAIIEAGESPEFRDGWNECRETMLQMLKARSA